MLQSSFVNITIWTTNVNIMLVNHPTYYNLAWHLVWLFSIMKKFYWLCHVTDDTENMQTLILRFNMKRSNKMLIFWRELVGVWKYKKKKNSGSCLPPTPSQVQPIVLVRIQHAETGPRAPMKCTRSSWPWSRSRWESEKEKDFLITSCDVLQTWSYSLITTIKIIGWDRLE